MGPSLRLAWDSLLRRGRKAVARAVEGGARLAGVQLRGAQGEQCACLRSRSLLERSRRGKLVLAGSFMTAFDVPGSSHRMCIVSAS